MLKLKKDEKIEGPINENNDEHVIMNRDLSLTNSYNPYEVTFSPGIDKTLISSKSSKSSNEYVRIDNLKNVLHVEEEIYGQYIKQSEGTVITKAVNVLKKIKEKIITLLLILLPPLSSLKRKKLLRKNKLDNKSRKALEQFKQLAALYIMYCHTEDEIIAYEFAFDKLYYDMVTYSMKNGYDEEFFKRKINEFITIFEP